MTLSFGLWLLDRGASVNTALMISYGIQLIVMALLFLVPVAIILRRELGAEVNWWRRGRREFTAWKVRQQQRRDFLVRCGASQIVAVATLLDEATSVHIDLCGKDGSAWATRPAKAMADWMDALASELYDLAAGTDPLSEERDIALQASRRYRDALEDRVNAIRKLTFR